MVGSLLLSFFYCFNIPTYHIGEVTGYMLKPKKRIGFVSDKVPSAHSRVPLYDKDGRFIIATSIIIIPTNILT